MKFGFALVEDGSNNPVLSFQHQIGQACLNEQQTKVMHFAGTCSLSSLSSRLLIVFAFQGAKDSEPLHWSRNVYGWTRSDSNTGGRFIPVTQAMFRDVKTLTSPLSPGGKQSVKELIGTSLNLSTLSDFLTPVVLQRNVMRSLPVRLHWLHQSASRYSSNKVRTFPACAGTSELTRPLPPYKAIVP